MRIPKNTLVSDMLRNVSTNRNAVSEKYLQISTGKKYLKRSDDPLATNQVANTQSYVERTEQWSRNLELAGNWEMASDAKLSEMLKSMQRTRELMVEANNGTITPEDKKNIALEVNSIIEDLVTQMNADYSGTPMFSGKGVRPTAHAGHWNSNTMGTQPAPGDAGMPAAVAWDDLSQAEYNTWNTTQMTGGSTSISGNTIKVPIGAKDWSNFDLTGSTIELATGETGRITSVVADGGGNYDITVESWQGGTPAGTPNFTITDFAPGWVDPNGQTFTATKNAAGDITTVTYNGSQNKRQIQVYDKTTTLDYGTTGNELTNYTVREWDASTSTWNNTQVNLFDTLIQFRDDLQDGKISNQTILNRVDEGLNNIITKNVDNGVSQNQIKSQISNATSNYSSSVTRLSDLEDIDVAAAITELSQMESALNATLQMIPRMNSLSIMNFI